MTVSFAAYPSLETVADELATEDAEELVPFLVHLSSRLGVRGCVALAEAAEDASKADRRLLLDLGRAMSGRDAR